MGSDARACCVRAWRVLGGALAAPARSLASRAHVAPSSTLLLLLLPFASRQATFFNPATSAAIKERMSGGKDADLKSAVKVRVQGGEQAVVCAVAAGWLQAACHGPPASRPTRPSLSAPSPPHSPQVYKPLMPKDGDQAFWQGGMLVFEGPTLLWGHADQGMAAHADLGQVVAAATRGL